MEKSIEIKEVVLRYPGTDFNAVDNIHLDINKGEVFGLLGPNGAGKTTLISILTGLLKQNKGIVKIHGLDNSTHLPEIKTIIGVVSQEYALYPKLSAIENLQFFGSMYAVQKKELNSRIKAGIEKLGLTKFAHKRIDTYSGGMKRRINLLAGILHHPKIIFLDEPTVGVDVHSKQLIINFLKEINSKGTTIVYTSHLLHEAESFCTRVAIIDNGKIKTEGPTAEIIMKNGELKSLEEIFIEITGKHRELDV